MTIAEEFIKIIHLIADTIDIPLIEEIYIPRQASKEKDSHKSNFGAIKLDDGTVGVVYVSLSTEIKDVADEIEALIPDGFRISTT